MKTTHKTKDNITYLLDESEIEIACSSLSKAKELNIAYFNIEEDVDSPIQELLNELKETFEKCLPEFKVGIQHAILRASAYLENHQATKVYSEEQMYKLVDILKQSAMEDKNLALMELKARDFIQSIKPQIESVDVEMEEKGGWTSPFTSSLYWKEDMQPITKEIEFEGVKIQQWTVKINYK